MVFGTFDGLHEGHINFFAQARHLANDPFLVVSVARDKNVKKIKGESPEFKEKERLAFIKNSVLVDRAVLAGLENHLPHILKEKPEIIALGYDQIAYIKNLKKDLENQGLMVKIIRLKPYKKHIYKNHLLKKRRVI